MRELDSDLMNIIRDAPAISEHLKEKQSKKILTPRIMELVTTDDASVLKKKIVEIINERKIPYSEFYEYCAKIKDTDDLTKGRREAQNYLSGLQDHPKCFDRTICVLCDFLNIKIVLTDREECGELDVDESLVPSSKKELHFDVDDKCSDLKKLIIEKINEKNLTYKDIYRYCLALNPETGKRDAMNAVTTLKGRDSMYDSTFLLLADFINCDISIVEK